MATTRFSLNLQDMIFISDYLDRDISYELTRLKYWNFAIDTLESQIRYLLEYPEDEYDALIAPLNR